MEEFDVDKFNLIDKAVTLVASSKSGKTYLLTDLLYQTIFKPLAEVDIITIIIYCQSLVDGNLYFILYLYYNLIDQGYDVLNEDYKILSDFKLTKYIQKQATCYLTKNYSDFVIKQVLDTFIDTLVKGNYFKKRSYFLKYNKCVFLFSGAIIKSNLTKLFNGEIKSSRNRKYIIIIDDVSDKDYKPIKDDVTTIYKQGRHHDISCIIIEQYIKAEKVSPDVRTISSFLMIRSFDEKIRREIMEICAFDRNDIDAKVIKEMLSQFYCLIIDYSDKSKLYYYKSPPTVFEIFKQIRNI